VHTSEEDFLIYNVSIFGEKKKKKKREKEKRKEEEKFHSGCQVRLCTHCESVPRLWWCLAPGWPTEATSTLWTVCAAGPPPPMASQFQLTGVHLAIFPLTLQQPAPSDRRPPAERGHNESSTSPTGTAQVHLAAGRPGPTRRCSTEAARVHTDSPLGHFWPAINLI